MYYWKCVKAIARNLYLFQILAATTSTHDDISTHVGNENRTNCAIMPNTRWKCKYVWAREAHGGYFSHFFIEFLKIRSTVKRNDYFAHFSFNFTDPKKFYRFAHQISLFSEGKGNLFLQIFAKLNQFFVSILHRIILMNLLMYVLVQWRAGKGFNLW